MKAYEHFTLSERESLSKYLAEGKPIAQIAQELGRNRSNIYREVRRNSDENGEYLPITATSKYLKRRKKCKRGLRFVEDEKLIRYTEICLNKYWSPETIAVKWKQENPSAKLSHTTIYRAIESKLLPRISGFKYLRRRNKQKYIRPNSMTIKPDYTIHERPEVASKRVRIGDWEGDVVHGGRGKGYLITVADRKSRYLKGALNE
ncbi:MAG TPA: IS30 family transposase, partial [Clostridia bacterium]|nr:IS30 family transposase [Clostridia bacterium]